MVHDDDDNPDDEAGPARAGDRPPRSEDPPSAGPGVEQFQKAALDAVAAVRTMLDAAESMIREPAAFDMVTNTVTAFARAASETVAGLAGGLAATASARPTESRSAEKASRDERSDDDGYHDISVS